MMVGGSVSLSMLTPPKVQTGKHSVKLVLHQLKAPTARGACDSHLWHRRSLAKSLRFVRLIVVQRSQWAMTLS